jgi:hypothetical protein
VLVTGVLGTACAGAGGSATPVPREPIATAPVSAGVGVPGVASPGPALPAPAPAASPSVAASVGPLAESGVPPTPAPTPTPLTVYVASLNQQPVYLYNSPTTGDRIQAYPSGTALDLLGEEIEGDGMTWHHVRAPDGTEGYVLVEDTAPALP